MRLFLLGATGRTGGEALDLALAHGHDVTAFVRSPQKLAGREHDRLRVVAGDPRDPAALRDALPEHDAVLSALGAHARDALRPSTLLTECATILVDAMIATGVPRIALISAAVLFPGGGLYYALFRWLLRYHARDLVGMEGAVRESPLDWTVARPPRLVRAHDERYRAVRDAIPDGSTSVSFRAVASFLLHALEQRAHVNEIVGVAR